MADTLTLLVTYPEPRDDVPVRIIHSLAEAVRRNWVDAHAQLSPFPRTTLDIETCEEVLRAEAWPKRFILDDQAESFSVYFSFSPFADFEGGHAQLELLRWPDRLQATISTSSSELVALRSWHERVSEYADEAVIRDPKRWKQGYELWRDTGENVWLRATRACIENFERAAIALCVDSSAVGPETVAGSLYFSRVTSYDSQSQLDSTLRVYGHAPPWVSQEEWEAKSSRS